MYIQNVIGQEVIFSHKKILHFGDLGGSYFTTFNQEDKKKEDYYPQGNFLCNILLVSKVIAMLTRHY